MDPWLYDAGDLPPAPPRPDLTPEEEAWLRRESRIVSLLFGGLLLGVAGVAAVVVHVVRDSLAVLL